MAAKNPTSSTRSRTKVHECPFCKGSPGRSADEDWPDLLAVLRCARLGHLVEQEMQKCAQEGWDAANAQLKFAEKLGLDVEKLAGELLANSDSNSEDGAQEYPED